MGRRARVAAAFVAASLVLGSVGTELGSPAGAVITGASGDVVLIAPPPAVLSTDLKSPTDAYAFDEQQGVTLASQLTANFAAPGTYDELADQSTVRIPAGTSVDSHFVHSSNVSGGTALREFTLTFPTDILGVIVGRSTLANSDYLGAPQTDYPGLAPNRELEFGSGSGSDIVVLPDRRTIQASLSTPGSLDQMRVVTVHNSPPTADAGGPYTGAEGAPIALSGTAADTDGDAVTTSWSLTWSGDPGTTCTTSAGTTLTPSVTCDDDALVTATLSANDGVNPPVTSSTPITVGNGAPTLGAMDVPTTAVALGTAATVDVALTDAGTNDTHTATVSWGDTTSSPAGVTESGGTGTVSASHTYALPGLYTVTVTVEDDDLGTVSTTAQVTVNGPPAADAGGPYNGSEGLPTALAGTAVDPEGDPLAVAWTFTPSALDAGGTCTPSGTTTLTPSVTCDDDAVVAGDLSASDGVNAPVVSSTTLAVANEAPLLGALVVTPGPIATGTPVSVLAPFTDDGAHDTHTATVDWGDLTSSTASVSELAGAGSLATSHSYAAPGIYPVTVTLEDDDLGTDVRTATVVVNSAPTASAGGPYAGLEGSALALAGTAGDPDGDALTISWTFGVAGDPGTVCTPVGSGTLTPTLTCNDDATVTATLTVSDGVNAPVTDATTLTVGNAAPQATPLVASSPTAPTGSTVSVGLTFSDDGTNDTHAGTIDWGDASVDAATVTSSVGSGTASGFHAYSTAGTYTITATITDDDGATTSETTTVVVNGVPTAGAGGPYHGVEGAPLVLTGTAADPDADALLISWTSSIVTADVGTACSLTGADTLTPSLTCDDDASVEVTLSVGDGVNPTVVDTVTVDVANADPAVAAPTVVPNPVPLGAPVALTTGFTDPGVNDTHTSTISWGDSSSGPGTVAEVPGSGIVTGGHTYSAPGTYLVKVTVNDKDGGTSSATVSIVVNAPPGIDAAGPYSGVEGTPLALAGTATDADGDPLALSWSFAVATDPGGACTMSGTATLVPSVTCSDDATITATLTADDGVNAPVVDTTTITVANEAPGIGLVTVPSAPVPVGTSVTALTTFVDVGSNDTHTATISWGDATGSVGLVTESGGNGSVSGTHAYTTAGTYTVSITVVDDDTGTVTGTAASRVVVFDSGNGFITGGGWINSPSGAYTPANASDADLVGRAEFGFVIRKRASDPVPTGNTEFQMRLRKAGHDDHGHRGRDDRRDDGWSREVKFDFKSTSYTSLAVTGTTKGVYRGTGKVNGATGYSFLVSVVDGRSTHSSDRFRIKIWNTATGAVLYDTEPGAAEDATAVTPAGCGSIVIH
jgi:PKD repeat protein